FLYDPDDFFRENIGRVSGAQYLAGCHRPAERGAGHATDQLLRVLERLAVFEADPQPRLVLEGIAASDRVALHPGSGSERKNWPERNWRELIDRLAGGRGLRLLLVGGEAEGERLSRLSAGLPGGRVEVLRSGPLPEVARRLAGCRGFIGHDSGISHLAAAVGLPGLVLWGPTTRDVWQPRSPRVRILESGPDLASLEPPMVFEALEVVGWVDG
ncbi:MAG: glycosyltransferase family 9 protein, partial [Verrucomicrobiota bacterium]